jgi:biotin-(acetyl-CoA carboxylase) ligase
MCVTTEQVATVGRIGTVWIFPFAQMQQTPILL